MESGYLRLEKYGIMDGVHIPISMSRPFEGRIRSLEELRRNGSGTEKPPVRLSLPRASGDSRLTTEEAQRRLTEQLARERVEREELEASNEVERLAVRDGMGKNTERKILGDLRGKYQNRRALARYHEQLTAQRENRPVKHLKPLPVIDDARRASLQDLLRQYDRDAEANGIVDIAFPQVDVRDYPEADARVFDPQSREAAIERSRARARAGAASSARQNERASQLIDAARERQRAGAAQARAEAKVRADEKERERVRRLTHGNPNGSGTRAAYHLLDDGAPNVIIDNAGEYVDVPADEVQGADFNARPLSTKESAGYWDAILEPNDSPKDTIHNADFVVNPKPFELPARTRAAYDTDAIDAVRAEDARRIFEARRAAAARMLTPETAPTQKEATPMTREEIYASMIPLMAKREQLEAEEVKAEQRRNAPPIIDGRILQKLQELEARTQEIETLQANITDFDQKVEQQMQEIEQRHGVNPLHYDIGSISPARKLWTLARNAFHVLKGTPNESPAAALRQNRINRQYLIEQQAKLTQLIEEKARIARELDLLTHGEEAMAARDRARDQTVEGQQAAARRQVRRMGSLRRMPRPDYLPEAANSDQETGVEAEERARAAFERVMDPAEAAALAAEYRHDANMAAKQQRPRLGWSKKDGRWYSDARYGAQIDSKDWDDVLNLDQAAQETPSATEEDTDDARFKLGDSDAHGRNFAVKRRKPPSSDMPEPDELDIAA